MRWKGARKMPKTVYGLIKEARENLRVATKYNDPQCALIAFETLNKAIDAIDNGGSLETVVRN